MLMIPSPFEPVRRERSSSELVLNSNVAWLEQLLGIGSHSQRVLSNDKLLVPMWLCLVEIVNLN